VENAVYPEPDAPSVFHRFDVDIGGVELGRLCQRLGDQAYRRGIVDRWGRRLK
jgi:hypothetical protein